jgi:UDP-2,4-diacetamido-2,4,6-trideoxy-beta-L-altropyranose hydrolase
MKVAVRADAGIHIGAGHVMRCLTLAEALREHGGEITFICRAHTGHLADTVRARGHDCHLLTPGVEGAVQSHADDDPPHAAWLGADWRTDAAETRAILADDPVDLLIVDHYALDHGWEAMLRPVARRIMVIDDLADRRHDCDALLDQTAGRAAHDYAGHVPASCHLMIGAGYALVRPEFAARRAESLHRRDGPARTILISMGAFDQANATALALDALSRITLPAKARVFVLLNRAAPHFDQVARQAAHLPFPVEMLSGVDDMAGLLAETDLVIGAAGSSAWERCVLGVPSIILVLADNQRLIAENLADAGAAIHAGNAGSTGAARLADAIIAPLLADPAQLHALGATAAQLCDGDGATRVVREVVSLP